MFLYNLYVQYPPKLGEHVSYFEAFYNLNEEEIKAKFRYIIKRKEFILLNVEIVKIKKEKDA